MKIPEQWEIFFSCLIKVAGIKQKESPNTDLTCLSESKKSHRAINPSRNASFERQSSHGEEAQGRQGEQLAHCSHILKEMLSKKHASYAWPFYKPVDAEALQLHDYHDIIKYPMDLSTVKVGTAKKTKQLKVWSSFYDALLYYIFLNISSFPRKRWMVHSI